MSAEKPIPAVVAWGASRVSDALRAMKSGETGVDVLYLDRYVDAAVSDVRRLGLVSDDQLEFVRDLLRAQLTTDPVLIELVRRASGIEPSA